MPVVSVEYQKVQVDTMRASRRAQPHSVNPRFQCQLCHVTTGYAFLVAMCIFMLPMLVVAAERVELVTTDHMNPMDQQCIHLHHTTFKHTPFMLPSLSNVLPAMALMNEIVKSNIWCLSHSSSHASVRHVSFSPGFSVPSGLGRMVVGAVVVLLLLMSGDIEMNPGPVGNKLTSDDLGCVLEGVLDAAAQWYNLGLKLKVRTGRLNSIRTEFNTPEVQLREMLHAWLTTGDNPSWKTLIDALRSPLVAASHLAVVLEAEYCPIERTESDIDGHSETSVLPPSSVSEPAHRVILHRTILRESMRTFPSIDETTSPEPQAPTGIIHTSIQHQHTQGPQCDPELKVFNLYCNKLVESISHPERLAFELHSQDMISIKLCDETMKITGPSTYCKASKLVAAVKDQITKNPSVLHKFLSVVIRDPSLVYIADAMSDHYRSLLAPKGANTSLPTLSQLSAELRDFEDWYLLGLQLNVCKDILDSIERTCNTRVRCCIEMVQHWINNSTNPSWDTIHEALRNIGESVIAEKIAVKFNVQPSITREEKLPAPSLEHSSSKSEGTTESSSTTKVRKPNRLICQEQRRIISYFATVVDKITEIIETVVELEKLLRFLRFYSHPLYPEMHYIDKHILQNTKSVSEVMECLVPEYTNYMETGLLEDIIERFECKEAQSLLQQYHDRYPINRLLRDMPDPVSDERLDLTQRKRLRVMCNDDYNSARASDVKRIQTAIESATGIDHWFVTHAQHSEGSLKLTFLIPESVVSVFQELCGEDLEILAKAGIMELQIDDFVISDIQKYCPQKMKRSTQSISTPSAGQSGATAKGFDSYIEQREDSFTSKEKDEVKRLLESIPKSRMEEMCSDSFLRQLATHMKDWRELASHLGISELRAKELAYHYSDKNEQRYWALHCWKQINPDTGTYKHLIACLLAHAPFDLAENVLKMLTPGTAMQETHKLLREAYLSDKSRLLWTGAPELLQFNRRLGKVTNDTDKQLRNIDYSSWFETLEHFPSVIETVSIKSFVNAIAGVKDKPEKRGCLFLIKGPPGSGRSAVLRRVCSFWARGFCLRKFTLVLWLDLKDRSRSPSDVSLKTLLSYCLPWGSDLDSIQQWIERHGAQDVLIVIDSVEGQAYNEWKPFLDLLDNTEASVILTDTHPWDDTDDWQYDVLGLSQDQISKQVIYHYHQDTAKAEEFLMYISESHDIRALCSSPPYLAAVLFVFDSVSTSDLPNTWTHLFSSLTSLKRSLLSCVLDHDTLAILASKAYTVTSTNSTLKWHDDYTNFCTRISSPYQTIVATSQHCFFTLPLLQHYLCAQHIHTLPQDEHIPALNKETVPLHVKRFYVGLCNSPDLIERALSSENRLLYAACVSEVVIEGLKNMTSELTFGDEWLTSFDIYCVFKAVHYSELMCKLEFHRCHFGSLTFEMMAKWLRTYSILPNGGAVQELSLIQNRIRVEGVCELAKALQVNKSLWQLNLSENEIKADGVCALAEALQVNQSLQQLDLSRNKITDEGICELARALQANQSLQELNLSENEIKADGVCALAEALQVNQSLQQLDLSRNKITDEGICELARALQANQSLQELNLSRNEITDEGIRELARALQANQSLQELNLSRNEITDEGIRELARALQANQSLQELNLSRNEITDEGIRELARALQANQSLQELNLSANEIKTDGVRALAGALQVNQSLQQLDLSRNEITDEGIRELARALQANQSLQELNLSASKIEDKGTCELAGALRVNQNLQKLNLSANKIEDEGTCELAGALRVNQSLQKLNLSKNNITDKRVCTLAVALQMNQRIQELNLSYNRISADGVCALVGALLVNQSLQKLKLHVSGNESSAEDMYAVFVALQKNPSLKKLDLSWRKICDVGVCALARALRVNQSLRELDLSANKIEDKGTHELAGTLRVNQSLQELNLSKNNITDERVCTLAVALQMNQRIQELNLSYNRISADGVCALVGALLVNQSLQKLKLHLSGNESSAEDMHAVFVALQKNPILKKLDLSWRKICDVGVYALARALRVNQSLRELNLSYNRISADGVCALVGALLVNQSLQKLMLHLSGNESSAEDMYAVFVALQKNPSLKKLDLSFNQITDKGVRELARALQVNKSIRELDLSRNQISEEGAHELAAALRVNQSLQTLILSVNQIKDGGACALSEALRVNQSLQKLNVRYNFISRGHPALMEAQLKRKNLKVEGLDSQLR